MIRKKIINIVVFSLFFSIFINLNPSKAAAEEITGPVVDIIYGMTGSGSCSGCGYAGEGGVGDWFAVGWQAWNLPDRYGFIWLRRSTPGITNSDLTSIGVSTLDQNLDDGQTSGRSSNSGNDGSQGLSRWETNGSHKLLPVGATYFKVGIVNSSGTLIASSAEITIPAMATNYSGSGLSDLPVFYPDASYTNPYASGGLFNAVPEAPTELAPTIDGSAIDVAARFIDPAEVNSIEFSSDDGSTWLSAPFQATARGSIIGKVSVDTESDGTPLVNGTSYTIKIRAKNNSIVGLNASASCVKYQGTSLESCTSGGGGGSSGGGGGGTSGSSGSAPSAVLVTNQSISATQISNKIGISWNLKSDKPAKFRIELPKKYRKSSLLLVYVDKNGKEFIIGRVNPKGKSTASVTNKTRIKKGGTLVLKNKGKAILSSQI